MEVPSHNGHESDICDEEAQGNTQNSKRWRQLFSSGTKKRSNTEKDSIIPCDGQDKSTRLSQSGNISEL